MVEALQATQITGMLADLPGWQFSHSHNCPDRFPPDLICRNVSCLTFTEALEMTKLVAEALKGHKDHLAVSIYSFPHKVDVIFMLRVYNEDETNRGWVFGVSDLDLELPAIINTTLS